MSDEYTPPTEEVEHDYANMQDWRYEERREEFQRWIAQHDTEQAKKILVAFAAGGYGFNEMFQADGKWVIEIKDGMIASVEEFVGDFTDGFHAAQYFEHVADAIAAKRGDDV